MSFASSSFPFAACLGITALAGVAPAQVSISLDTTEIVALRGRSHELVLTLHNTLSDQYAITGLNAVYPDATGVIDLEWVFLSGPLTLDPGETATLPVARFTVRADAHASPAECALSIFGATDGESANIGATVFFVVAPADNDCLADANGDRVVDFLDLNQALADYGLVGVGIAGDIDGDGDCDFVDLNGVLGAYGQPCPIR